jgi:hypothetical protein
MIGETGEEANGKGLGDWPAVGDASEYGIHRLRRIFGLSSLGVSFSKQQ